MQERVELLKAGISGKRIEELYIEGNDMKIMSLNLLYIGEEFKCKMENEIK